MTARPGGAETILVVEDEERIRKLITVALRQAGYGVVTAADGGEALARVAEATPDLIVSDLMMPNVDGLELLTRLRESPATRGIPLILLTAKSELADIVAGLELGADDYLAKPFNMPELLARVRTKIDRPPVPSEELPRDRQTGLLSEPRFVDEMRREQARAEYGSPPGCVAYLYLDELPVLRERLGARAEAEIAKQLVTRVQRAVEPLGTAGRDPAGRFLLLLPETGSERARRQLSRLAEGLVNAVFSAGGERVRLTPTVGLAPLEIGVAPERVLHRARLALEHAAAHLDLQAVVYTPRMEAAPAAAVATSAAAPPRRWTTLKEWLRLPFQIAVMVVVGLVLPFLAYAALARYWVDVTPAMYLFVVLALLGTAILIWTEGFLALRRVDPPVRPGRPYPPASAIIAAYLPNEAATVEETVEAFLRADYSAPLQVILAYNTPRPLPVEAKLREIARRDPRFVPFRVEGSTSKAQNVNAALAIVEGEFVGVFDADHHPQEDSFTRAWRWLSTSCDVVQGHCLIRNGDATWVARMTAVEFEGMYAVSHPGRSRLHGFGIFGGSNGYWKTALLRQTRMHGFMLTEDIDSSLRVVEQGYRIVSDPYLISRELAPVTLEALWNQRLRWAQGWFQVSLKRLVPALRSPHLSLRQKLGMFHLLAWRELFPWIALQMFPIIAFWVWTRGTRNIDWFVPLFVLTSLFTLATGPGQSLFLARLAAPEIRQRRGWLLYYVVIAFVFYTEFKNLIARLAQVKEFMRERAWKVTPRSATADEPAAGGVAAPDGAAGEADSAPIPLRVLGRIPLGIAASSGGARAPLAAAPAAAGRVGARPARLERAQASPGAGRTFEEPHPPEARIAALEAALGAALARIAAHRARGMPLAAAADREVVRVVISDRRPADDTQPSYRELAVAFDRALREAVGGEPSRAALATVFSDIAGRLAVAEPPWHAADAEAQ